MKILSYLTTARKDPIDSDLDRTLCQLNETEPWTLRDAFEGLHVFGGTGSGKTSGSGRHFATAMLRAGFGGLVLTVKPDEAAHWAELADATGRRADLQFIRITDRGAVENPFNFLECERASAGSEAQAGNLASLFLTAARAMDGADGGSGDHAYWTDSLRQLLRSTILLIELAGETLSVPNISAVVQSASVDRKIVRTPAWNRSSFCAKLLREAASRTSSDDVRFHDFERLLSYFTVQLPSLPPNTRASVISTYTTKADMLMDGAVRSLLCGETSPAVRPERTHHGAIVIVDVPVLRWNEVGRLVQLLVKTVWQRATLRRGRGGDRLPGRATLEEQQEQLPPGAIRSVARSAMSERSELLEELLLVVGSALLVSITEACLMLESYRLRSTQKWLTIEPTLFTLFAGLYALAALFSAIDLLRIKCVRSHAHTGPASAHLIGWWCPSILCALGLFLCGPFVGVTCRVVGAVASTAVVEWQNVRTGRVPVPTPGRIAVHVLVLLRHAR